MLTFQQIILTLQHYWDGQRCALLQPFDMEVGAGTSAPATFLRALGPEPWRAAYVQPSRRPKDARYGENPNRLYQHHQFQVVLKPAPENILDLYLDSLRKLGFDLGQNDVRFVEDDWENPTLGAWGLGWEVWMNGMEITQFTYFQQVGGLDCKPITGEITYGLERLAMYLQGVENVFDLKWTDALRYRDVFLQNEREQSAYNFEQSDAGWLLGQFTHFEAQAKRLMEAQLALPAYEMVLKCGHAFNLLDARGAISVTERAAYIGRIRNLARSIAQSYYESRERLGFPMCEPAPKSDEADAGHLVAPIARAGHEPGMSGQTLLVELLTEELPPKALARLGAAFADGITGGLRSGKFLSDDSVSTSYATPRRLAVSITGVAAKAPDSLERLKILPVSVAYDASGKPTHALTKKLAAIGRSHAVSADFERALDGKTESLFYNYVAPGGTLLTGLNFALHQSVEKLPIPKVMIYQRPDGSDHKFVRPAHRLVALHGKDVIPVSVLGLDAGRVTEGHRFQGQRTIELAHADDYASTLAGTGKVIASFADRQAHIEAQLQAKAAELDADLQPDAVYAALLEEVTALTENPAVYVGEFEREFLDVPQECLILTMRTNQKYFPLFNRAGKLRQQFLIVSNMQLDDPRWVIQGNERVVRPRLADAKFFFDQDRKIRLADRVARLANVVYHNKLGTQLQRVERLQKLAAQIAKLIGSDLGLAQHAAALAKADLLTEMVGEFPELQGIMGRYYALHDGEAAEVADAIEQHYRPKFAGDRLPEGPTAICVALADRLDTLAGIYGIGLIPTGDKDAFGLRRHALGVLRILIERKLPIELTSLLQLAADRFPQAMLSATVVGDLHGFILERLRGLLREQGYSANEVEAVISQQPTRIDLVPALLAAVREFSALPEAAALAAANKRIQNILKKSPGATIAAAESSDTAAITTVNWTTAEIAAVESSDTAAIMAVDPSLFADAAERSLHRALLAVEPLVAAELAAGRYTTALKVLAGLRGAVDAFFEQVLVNADDPAVRANRLALLNRLGILMNQVADISKLAN